MKIYFDTEFTKLSKDAQLISIGLISDDNKEFYAEFTDFDRYDCNEWIEENVLINTSHYGNTSITDILLNEEDYHLGTKEDIKKALLEWFDQYESIELISDVSHYDMVLFIDLFGTALDLPEKIFPVCHDINQDIALYHHITTYDAFDIGREEMLSNNNIIIKGAKHNSLYDAKVIKALHEILGN